MIFGSKLLCSFLNVSNPLFSQVSMLQTDTKKQTAVVPFNIYNSGLDHLCAIHFLNPSPPLFGF